MKDNLARGRKRFWNTLRLLLLMWYLMPYL